MDQSLPAAQRAANADAAPASAVGPASAQNRSGSARSGNKAARLPVLDCADGKRGLCAETALFRLPGPAQGGVEQVDLVLHLLDTALVDNLPPHDAAGECKAIACRGKLAPHAVDAFAQHDLDAARALVQDDHVEGLAVFHADLDLVVADGGCSGGMTVEKGSCRQLNIMVCQAQAPYWHESSSPGVAAGTCARPGPPPG